jgi:hypothetical protein
MRHRDRATANGRIHPRDPGQLAVPCWPSHEGPAARVCGVARSTPWTSSRRATRLSGHLARPDSRLWRQAIGSSRHICFASRVAVAKLRLDGTPTPRSWVARMTKRPAPTGVGKSASRAEARKSGSLSMSGYVWDLSGTDNRCHLYGPGHLIHWIHFNHSMREPSEVIPVTAEVDEDGLVHIEGDEVSLVRWNHRPALLRDALHRFGGIAVWKPRWYILAVPEEAFFGGARSVFSLAWSDERRECHVSRSANADHLAASPATPAGASRGGNLGRARGQERQAAQDRLQPYHAVARR